EILIVLTHEELVAVNRIRARALAPINANQCDRFMRIRVVVSEIPGYEYFPVWLECTIRCVCVIRAAGVDREDRSSSSAKARIQGAVGSKTNNGKSVVAARFVVRVAGRNDLAVSLDRNGVCPEEA